MQRIEFPENFLWGAATASYQIEGAAREGGKGESIWDRFSHIPGKIVNNDTGDIACDHYHLCKKDVALMKELGIKSYRFSISWPRVFPDGTGAPNKEGIQFYKDLVKLLLEHGIIPAVTLYHWDLPQKLQDIGGWANREVADYFERYATYLFQELGELVPFWITHNEPWVAAFIGNWQGRHAPGLTDYKTAVQVAHHLLLSHGKAVRAYRNMGLKGEIGISLNTTMFYSFSESEADKAAAIRNDGSMNRWFADPVMKGAYPQDIWQWYKEKELLPEIIEEDMETIGTPVDFLGVNYYFSEFIAEDKESWPLELRFLPTGRDKTEMDWEICPDGLYDLLLKLDREYSGIKLMITENGAAFNDVPNLDGKVEDDNRLDYLRRHFIAANRAIQDGVNLSGYYVWSLMDNFEWALGYSKRFGIIYVDYKSKRRIIKKSGQWYRDFIHGGGFDLPTDKKNKEQY